MSISQTDFDHLMSLGKEFKESDTLFLNEKWTREIVTTKDRYSFLLDYHKGKIQIENCTFNQRYRTNIILVRYDSSGRHVNPDGKVLLGPHVHLYREGYMDKFAFPPDEIGITSEMEKPDILARLLKYCNVIRIPAIQVSLV